VVYWLPLWFASCRCSGDAPHELKRPDASVPSDCQRDGSMLTLTASVDPNAPTPAEVDPTLELPFATEPGTAIALGEAFFATGLRHDARGAVALLARLRSGAEAGVVVELGRVLGDVAPPRLAGDGTDLVVAVQEPAADGHELRLARLNSAALDQPPLWRAGPHQPRNDSELFDVAVQAGQVVLVWEDWVAETKRGRVLAATFTLDAPESAAPAGVPLSGVTADAESPRVAARPGGFWAAWIVNAGSAARVYDPGADERGTPAGDQGSNYGVRHIEVVPLDGLGRVAGAARRLTPDNARIVGYDLTAGTAGNAWIAWRQDAPSPVTSGGRIFMTEVRLDGVGERVTVRQEDVGAGEPSWLPGGLGTPWLTFPDQLDGTLLMRVHALGAIDEPLRLEAALNGAAALAASGSNVFFAAPRGRAVELFSAHCGLGPPRVAPSAVLDAGAPKAAPTGAHPPAADAG